MKLIFTNRRSGIIPLIFLLCLSLGLSGGWERAQMQAKLSLADILTGLRSKKTTMANKNKLLAEGVEKRGVSFKLTPEIEKELRDTGASDELIKAIREKIRKTIKSPTPSPNSPLNLNTNTYIDIPKITTPSSRPAKTPVSSPNTISRVSPTDVSTYIRRGEEYLESREFDKAIDEFTKAIVINPKNFEAFRRRGFCHFIVSTTVSKDNKTRFTMAVNDANTAVELDPNDAENYYYRAFIYRAKDYKRSIADISKAIELAPRNSIYYSVRGNIYGENNKNDLAIADYTKAVELSPNSFGDYAMRGGIYEQQGKYDLAIADYQRALRIAPNLGLIELRLQVLLRKKKN
jgi:tetratricopeptide (TPR) repeat protein